MCPDKDSLVTQTQGLRNQLTLASGDSSVDGRIAMIICIL
jgi:hypothetical protein